MDVPRVYLLPGEMCAENTPTQIDTLLGSCVAVCLFNKRHKFGGMNHYMLPRASGDMVPSGKHGDYSTEMLIKRMLAFDPVIGNIEASVMGGGNVTGHLSLGTGIGANNIVMAGAILNQYGIPVVNKNIGGDHGRKIFFKNWTGEVEVRRIEKSGVTRALEAKSADMASRRIRVLVVDDSKTVRSLIIDAITDDPAIEVVGEAENPYEARELLLEHDPDVICLDIIMPKMDGITFLKKLFQYAPKPVIIISTVAQKGSKLREQAEKIGAVDVIDKETLKLYEGPDVVKTVLVNKIKMAAKTWVKKKTKEELDAI